MKSIFIPLVFCITLSSVYSTDVYRPKPVMPLDSQILRNVRISLHRYIGSPMIQQVSEISLDSERNTTPCPMIFELITSCISPFKEYVRASTKQAEVYEISETDDISNSTNYIKASDVPNIINASLERYNLKLNEVQKQKIQSDFSPKEKNPKVKNNIGSHRLRRSEIQDLSKWRLEK